MSPLLQPALPTTIIGTPIAGDVQGDAGLPSIVAARIQDGLDGVLPHTRICQRTATKCLAISDQPAKLVGRHCQWRVGEATFSEARALDDCWCG
jgi:hypothetical protein